MATPAPAMPASPGKLLKRPAYGSKMGATALVKRNKLIFGGLAFVTLVGGFFGVYRPQSAKVNEAKAQAEAVEAQVARLNAELSHLKGLQANAPALRESARKADEALPNQTDLAKFILQVQDVSTKSGLDWLSANPVPPVASTSGTPGLQEVVVKMTAEGNFFAVQDFIGRMENLDRAVKIGSVNLTSNSASPGNANPKVSAQFDMKMYVAPTVAAPQASATATPRPAAAA